jgi:hypothetical protein
MKLPSLPWSGVATILSRSKLALLGGALLCLASVAATAQSVTFAGAVSILPLNPGNQFLANGVAVDSAGNLFVISSNGSFVVELPRTSTGFGPQTTLPFSGLAGPTGIAVDSSGDIFIADNGNSRVVELPRTATGYGPQIAVPFNDTTAYGLTSIAVDGDGNLFVTDGLSGPAGSLFEFPRTSTGYGSQTTLLSDGPSAVAVDRAGDLFVGEYPGIYEVPKTSTGFGQPSFVSNVSDVALALDSTGNLFVAESYSEGVVEFPWTGTGYGPGVPLPAAGFEGGYSAGVAVDSAGNVFYADTRPRVVEVQTHSVEFGSAYVCTLGIPVPCSQTLTLNYNVTASGTLGTPLVLTGGAPDLDFTLASGSTCTGAVTAGATCTVNVTFTPMASGVRNGAVEITDGSGTVITTTAISGLGGATAQSVTFAGAPTTLPFPYLSGPHGIAVDAAGDVFVADSGDGRVLELPDTATGYLQPTTVWSGGFIQFVAVDGAGDLFLLSDAVYEVPKTVTGYGAQITLPFSGLNGAQGIAADSAGDVFIDDAGNGVVLELPKAATGYGPQITLPLSGLNNPAGVAVDGIGNVFVADDNNNRVVELPWTGTGYGPQVTVLTGVVFPYGVAVDSAEDIFIAPSYGPSQVLEFPWTGTGYGPQTVVSFGRTFPIAVAAGNAQTVFYTDFIYSNVTKVQTQAPINLGGAYACAPGQTIPVPCSQTQTLNYNVNLSGTLGTPQVLTGGVPDLDFTLASGSTCTGAVSAGTICAVNVAFAPLAVGTRKGTVEITDHSGRVIATTPIYGLGLEAADAPPAAQAPPSLQFGTIAFGSTETLPLKVENIGAGTLSFTPTIEGQSFVIAGNTCGGGLTTGQSCTLQVEFSPVLVGGHTELLALQNNGSTIAGVTLVGNANVVVPIGTPPAAQVSTTYLPFGTIAFGTTETLGVGLTNIGGGYLYATGSVRTNSGSDSRSYTVTANNCKSVTSGNSCTLQVQFSPGSITTHDDFLTVNTNGGKFSVDLAGKVMGLSVLGGVSGGTLKFGSVASGSTEVETLTVTNVGLPGKVTIGTTIKAGSGAGPYTILTTAENTCLAGIAMGQSCTLPIEFAPTTSGVHNDLLTLTPSAGGGETTVWLYGTTP